MAEVKKTETKIGAVELLKKSKKNGVTIEEIVIDGHKVGVMGSASEADREAQLKLLQMAIDGSSSPMEAIGKIAQVATYNEKKVDPDEEVTVNGRTYVISYKKKTLYNTCGDKVVSLEDDEELKDLNLDAPVIKALLVERAKNKR